MPFEHKTILIQNITVVYKSLDVKTINTGKLKTLFKAPPTLVDSPELILAVYPKWPLIVQFADDRVRITLQREISEFANVGVFEGVQLWKIALECHKLAKKSEIIAYGFNFDLGVTHTQEITTLIQRDFLSDSSKIKEVLGADSLSILPRLKYKKNQM